MRRHRIGLIWLCGMLLAVLLYATGPEHFLVALLAAIDHLRDNLAELLGVMGARALDIIRSRAIALFAIFLTLCTMAACTMAARRGVQARAALLVVGALFMALVWRPWGDHVTPPSHWLGAFVLAVVAAAVMTRRLLMHQPGRLTRGGDGRGG